MTLFEQRIVNVGYNMQTYAHGISQQSFFSAELPVMDLAQHNGDFGSFVRSSTATRSTPFSSRYC